LRIRGAAQQKLGGCDGHRCSSKKAAAIAIYFFVHAVLLSSTVG
jgi:hypothetical protein